MNALLKTLAITLLAVSLPILAQTAPAIDNERVTVWDVKLTKGESTRPTPPDMDAVIMFLEGGRILSVDGNGKRSTVIRNFGDAVFVPKATDARDTLLSDGTAHEIVIALKDRPSSAIPNTSGYPAAFPRPGSVKVLDNPRVTVWRYSWAPGVPTPMHFHDKEVVVAFRYDGALKSVTPNGTSEINSYKAGDILFNKANRVHYEVLTTAHQSAIVTELK